MYYAPYSFSSASLQSYCTVQSHCTLRCILQCCTTPQTCCQKQKQPLRSCVIRSILLHIHAAHFCRSLYYSCCTPPLGQSSLLFPCVTSRQQENIVLLLHWNNCPLCIYTSIPIHATLSSAHLSSPQSVHNRRLHRLMLCRYRLHHQRLLQGLWRR